MVNGLSGQWNKVNVDSLLFSVRIIKEVASKWLLDKIVIVENRE